MDNFPYMFILNLYTVQDYIDHINFAFIFILHNVKCWRNLHYRTHFLRNFREILDVLSDRRNYFPVIKIVPLPRLPWYWTIAYSNIRYWYSILHFHYWLETISKMKVSCSVVSYFSYLYSSCFNPPLHSPPTKKY